MIAKVIVFLRHIETGLLVSLFLTMLGVAVYQVVARNLAGTGLFWGDDLVRVAVLWVTMVGAMVASSNNGHIRIDAVTRLVGSRYRLLIERFTNLFTAIVCGALGWYSIDFITWDFQDQAPGIGRIPAWICELVIPFAAFVMCGRYLIQTILPVSGRDP